MKQAVIHIGLDKTGTSAIQKYLARNAHDVLRGTGFLYPDIGRKGHQHWDIAHACGFGFQAKPDDEARLRYGQRLGEAASARAVRGLVLSSEYFCYGAEPGHLIRLKEMLSGFDIRIVAYVRTLPSWLRSLYSESVKAGCPAEFAEFVSWHEERMDYAGFLERWRAVFGPSSLAVRLYERNRTSLAGSFLRIFNTSITVEGGAAPVNPSLDMADILILQKANRLLGHDHGPQASQFHHFYIETKRRRPWLWAECRMEGAWGFREPRRAQIVQLSKDFAQHVLTSEEERGFFTRLTLRDLDLPCPVLLPETALSALAARLADLYRDRRTKGFARIARAAVRLAPAGMARLRCP